jgi:hypothetical protein
LYIVMVALFIVCLFEQIIELISMCNCNKRKEDDEELGLNTALAKARELQEVIICSAY